MVVVVVGAYTDAEKCLLSAPRFASKVNGMWVNARRCPLPLRRALPPSPPTPPPHAPPCLVFGVPQDPSKYIPELARAGADSITFHWEVRAPRLPARLRACPPARLPARDIGMGEAAQGGLEGKMVVALLRAACTTPRLVV